MKRAEYSDFGEPTVQVALRLPESLVAAIDERRGNASRATYVAQVMSAGMSPKPVGTGNHVEIVEPVPSGVILVDPTTKPPCKHHKLVRGSSGLLRCADCGAMQR